jgi:20S proteasome alpha/beta subunit
VEYAIEAIKLGSTAIGIQTDEGVILAVEKRITSPLMEPTSIEKVRQRGQVAVLWIHEIFVRSGSADPYL